MATQYVYHATYEIQWEAPCDYGLFRRKNDAKAECEKQAGRKLQWDYSDPHHTTSEPDQFKEFYMVTRRPVR